MDRSRSSVCAVRAEQKELCEVFIEYMRLKCHITWPIASDFRRDFILCFECWLAFKIFSQVIFLCHRLHFYAGIPPTHVYCATHAAHTVHELYFHGCLNVVSLNFNKIQHIENLQILWMCGGRSHTGNDNDDWAKFYNFPFISLCVWLFFSPSELCISISLNLSSLSWPQQFNVEHKHTQKS